MNQLIMQTLAYGVVMLLGFGFVAIFLRGFFWKYLRVRLSLGKYVLVKIREVNRDFYGVGDVQEGMLIYKANKDKKRIKLPKDKPIFYKTMGITMIDVDSETNSVCTVNYQAVTGFDAIKMEQLLTRSLEKPQITDNKEKILFALLIVAVIGIVICAIFLFKLSDEVALIKATVENLNKGLITMGN